MEIEKLPVELLMRIFGYLPTYKKVSLVSRTFYNVACAVNDKNITLSLNNAVNAPLLWQGDLSLLQSIQETTRKISKVDIRGHGYYLYFKNEIDREKAEQYKGKEMGTVISILGKFSETIKYLRVEGMTMDVDNFVRILSLVPNAEQLVFVHIFVSQTAKKQRLISSTEDLNLKHLKTLHIRNCDEMFEVIFNRVPAGVLTELRLDSRSLPGYNDLFKRQTNIKKLDLFNSVADPDIFYNLKLESLRCIRWSGTNIVSALSRQTKLKSLTLGIQTSDEHLMKFVAPQLTELEKLDWHVVGTPAQDIVNIRRFRNLQHLTLNIGHRLDIFDAFCELNNLRITTLKIKPIRHQSIEHIRKLTTSVPLLKVLKVYNVQKWSQMNAILKHFNFVEGLHFQCDEEHNQDAIYLNQRDSVNSNLTELSINFPPVRIFNSTFIQKLFSDYPNLKKLTMKMDTLLIPHQPHSSAKFRLILDGFTKLEFLKLHTIDRLKIDDFKYLRDHKKNVKFVSLRFRNDDNFIDQHREELEAMFEVVKISPCNKFVEIKNL